MNQNINQTKLAIAMNLPLKYGAHKPPTDDDEASEMCVMEAVAFVAGEPWSDSPRCASPVISSFLRSWNDGLASDAERDRLLKPLIARLVGSKGSPEIELRRSYMAFDWLVRVNAPAFLRLTPSLKTHADTLSELLEIVDADSLQLSIKPTIDAVNAARVAARDAARAVYWDAVDAFKDAAGDAAWSGARDAARAVYWDALGTACDAAWEAARAAVVALQPTVDELQQSALVLIDRMLALTEVE